MKGTVLAISLVTIGTNLIPTAKILNPKSQISGTMSIEGIQKLIRRNLALLPHILTTTVIS